MWLCTHTCPHTCTTIAIDDDEIYLFFWGGGGGGGGKGRAIVYANKIPAKYACCPKLCVCVGVGVGGWV